MRIEEEQSADLEVDHTFEEVNFIAIQPGQLLGKPVASRDAAVSLSNGGILTIEAAYRSVDVEVRESATSVIVTHHNASGQTHHAFPKGRVTRVEFHGGNRSDRFVNRTKIADRVYGYGSDDFLRGGGGASHVNAGSGHDTVYGGDGEDTLRGGDGNDRLYGGEGNDFLLGGAGHDALLGGQGFDRLEGGRGADRFLRHDDGSAILPNSDWPLDMRTEDVWIDFVDGTGQFYAFADGPEFAPGADWTDLEIAVIDDALADLVEMTGSNVLLRTSDGRPVDFVRHGALMSNTLGWNTDGEIVIVDNAFATQIPIAQTVFHEIAHNWDEPGENDLILPFRNVGDWTFGGPLVDHSVNWEQHPDTPNSWKYWWFVDRDLALDGFARNYGKTNPLEDFATAFAAYVMSETGQNYVGNFGQEAPRAIQARMADRFAVLDAFFAQLG